MMTYHEILHDSGRAVRGAASHALVISSTEITVYRNIQSSLHQVNKLF